LIDKPLPKGLSARNMGKNDLWIAATASTLNIPLLTTDNDFDHLNGVFLEVKKVFI
jgi:predicted nucleic acid-binding protein